MTLRYGHHLAHARTSEGGLQAHAHAEGEIDGQTQNALSSRLRPGKIRASQLINRLHEALGTLTEKLNLRRAEPDEVLRRDGNRPPIRATCKELTFIVGEGGQPLTKESFGNAFL